MMKKLISSLILVLIMMSSSACLSNVNTNEVEVYPEWSIEELGEIIVASGIFWVEWWGELESSRFAWENFRSYEDTPIHLRELRESGFMELLPSSGFDELSDIRNYLLQFYTESFVDNLLFVNPSPPFIEYDGALLSFAGWIPTPRTRWESSIHSLLELDGSHATVETSVLYVIMNTAILPLLPHLDFSADRDEFYRELQMIVLTGAYTHPSTIPEELIPETRYRFEFINGRINSKMRMHYGELLEWNPFGVYP